MQLQISPIRKKAKGQTKVKIKPPPKGMPFQYDPGFYPSITLDTDATIRAVLNAKTSGGGTQEQWALHPTYEEPGPNHTHRSVNSVRTADPVALFPPPGTPSGSRLWKVDCAILTPTGWTGPYSTQVPGMPAAVGMYTIFQKFGTQEKRVGRLIVEPQGTGAIQHWFLFPTAYGMDEAFRRPGKNNPNESIIYHFDSPLVSNLHLPTFATSLGHPSIYIQGTVTFLGIV